MNKLTGFIQEIKSCDDIVQISIDIKGEIFTSLILSSNEVYKIGQKINILFKETEVMIASVSSKISARNAFICKITEIKNGEILSSISFDFYGDKIVSIITKNALLDLNCKENEEFMWFVKSNEISIQKV
ncbi:TOBE domain-containing protein [Arcobacter cloacae]|uniref:Molybdenum-pterin-binding protein n=1 Tax=Arcobacter cloacae TaxID=1054034 RepID=A0A6M8N702_9BACT|nr:molybdenum-pterin-binding protein [Arcobacter cloacae]NCB10938.1 molybdenum-pterin-binding protein [Erysipelotrichia bacterium]QKF89868.1 molybdenum-pterin binding domain-containing protein [Arcobacter cloacae]RXI39933.1 molybdenum-pterin-binding protein [Arcobacter cloacae]